MIELISLTLVIVHKIIVPCLICSAGSLYLSLRQISEYQTKKQKPSQPQAKRRSIPPGAEALLFPNFHRVSPETQRKLFAMCHGDHALVVRLARFNDQGAWEKAIYDLERDRH